LSRIFCTGKISGTKGPLEPVLMPIFLLVSIPNNKVRKGSMVLFFRFVLCFAEPLVSYMLLIQSLPNGCNRVLLDYYKDSISNIPIYIRAGNHYETSKTLMVTSSSSSIDSAGVCRRSCHSENLARVGRSLGGVLPTTPYRESRHSGTSPHRCTFIRLHHQCHHPPS
jgi:hypothetical protein